MPKTCSFCGKPETPNTPLLDGIKGSICQSCAEISKDYFEELQIKNSKNHITFLKPHEIKKELDKYIIGQEEAKKILSVAVYNHYKRIKISSNVDIQKTNVLLIGPSGSGKTYILQTLANILDVPFVIADATNLTETGFVGGDVEDVLEKLIIKAKGNIEKAEKGIIYIDEVDKLAKRVESDGTYRKSSGSNGVQECLLKMIEDSEVKVSIGDSLYNKKSVNINTKNILFVFGGAFTGLDEIVKNRLKGEKTNSIGFHFQTENNVFPLNQKSNKELPKVTQEDLIEYGLIPEFVGRIPLIVQLHELSLSDLKMILTQPKNAILKQYQALLQMDGVNVIFNDQAVEYIAEQAMKKKIGARGLKGIIEEKMIQLMFDLPQYEHIDNIIITKEMLMGNVPMIPPKRNLEKLHA